MHEPRPQWPPSTPHPRTPPTCQGAASDRAGVDAGAAAAVLHHASVLPVAVVPFAIPPAALDPGIVPAPAAP